MGPHHNLRTQIIWKKKRENLGLHLVTLSGGMEPMPWTQVSSGSYDLSPNFLPWVYSYLQQLLLVPCL